MTRIIFMDEIIVIKSILCRHHIPLREVKQIMLEWTPNAKGPAILDIEFKMRSSSITKRTIYETSFSNPLDAVDKISAVFGPVNEQKRKNSSKIYNWEIN